MNTLTEQFRMAQATHYLNTDLEIVSLHEPKALNAATEYLQNSEHKRLTSHHRLRA